MTTATFLFVLRIVSALLLLLFIAAAFVMMWRDYRAASREVATRTHRRGRLVVLKADGLGIKPGTEYPLMPLTSVGRAPTNTISIKDTFASGEHAMVTLRGGQWWLEDRGSINGTLLNGYRVEEPVVVSSGDIIGVGRVELKLELE
jgi:hypothetical protein